MHLHTAITWCGARVVGSGVCICTQRSRGVVLEWQGLVYAFAHSDHVVWCSSGRVWCMHLHTAITWCGARVAGSGVCICTQRSRGAVLEWQGLVYAFAHSDHVVRCSSGRVWCMHLHTAIMWCGARVAGSGVCICTQRSCGAVLEWQGLVYAFAHSDHVVWCSSGRVWCMHLHTAITWCGARVAGSGVCICTQRSRGAVLEWQGLVYAFAHSDHVVRCSSGRVWCMHLHTAIMWCGARVAGSGVCICTQRSRGVVLEW